MSLLDRIRRETQASAPLPVIGTIRPTVNTKPGDTAIVFEVQCRLCDPPRVYGPDTHSNVLSWLDAHARRAHRHHLVDALEKKSGNETWDERVRT